MSKQFTYTLKVDAEIGDLVSKVDMAKKSFSELSKTGKFPGIDKSFAAIERALERVQETAKTPITSEASFGKLQKDIATIEVQLLNLDKTINQISSFSDSEKMNFLPPELANNIRTVSKAVTTFSKVLEEAGKKSEELEEVEKNLAKAKKDLFAAQGKEATARQTLLDEQERIKTKKKEIETTKQQIEVLETYLKTKKIYDEAGAQKNKKFTDEQGNTYSLPKAKSDAKRVASELGIDLENDSEQAIINLTQNLETLNTTLEDCEATEKRYQNSLNKTVSSVTAKQNQVNGLTEQFESLNDTFEKNKASTIQQAFETLKQTAQDLGINLEGIPLEDTEKAIEEINKRIQEAVNQGFEPLNEQVEQAKKTVTEMGEATEKAGQKFSESSEHFREGNEKFRDNNAILEKIKAFVGLKGGIEIARNALRNAISTIKELDAVMTEMAVVTDLSVGDYWEQLPEHTAQANELGVAISEVYKAETLYYQQGLKTNEVTAMSAETLKMARIAGLSAEDATNKMTAALRGFNMELNETSAQRISDVYSELAAITAADVDEISSAMTKTASIASSAGMEFETTAAFLSQIIETTRESAETAGTAMKTVIARFQELKKDPAEIGEVDGEIVDANKIETALRSVGVALRDADGQFRSLDEVFMELSQKWNTLDTNTQRYIATIAAGSRQQSRFIAMMSDYSRTQELVAAANTSAGSSQQQFEKTTESLRSKLAELKNAWDSFTMSITDSELLKGAVEILTAIITKINEFTDLFGEFSGVAKITLLIAALYVADKAVNIFTKSIRDGNTIFASLGATAKGTFSSIGKDVNKATSAMGRYNISVKQSSISILTKRNTIKALNATQKKHNLTAAEYAAILSADAAAGTALSAAQATYITSLKLTQKEQKEANYLQTFGISATAAATLAASGLTQAYIEQKAALEGLTAEQTEYMVKQMASTAMDTAATAIKKVGDAAEESNGKSKGFLGTLLEITGLGSILKILKKLGTKLTGAGKGFSGLASSAKSFLVSYGPLLALLAALGAAIFGLIKYIKHLNNTSPEGKLKAARKATELAGKAAEEAAENYKELRDSFSSLTQKYKNLDEITKHTDEWRSAVGEINDEVMDLISKYPELAQMFENKDGVLQVKEGMQDDVDQYIREAELKAKAVKGAEFAAKMTMTQAENNVAYSQLSDSAKYGNQKAENSAVFGATAGGVLGGALAGAAAGAGIGSLGAGVGAIPGAAIGAILGGLAAGIGGGIGGHAAGSAAVATSREENQAITEKYAAALASGEILSPSNTEEIATWLTENVGVTSEQAQQMAQDLANSSEELLEFGRALNKAELQLKAYYTSMAQSVLDSVNMEGKSDKAQTQISQALTSEYMQAFHDKHNKLLDEDLAKMSDAQKKDWVIEQAKELYPSETVGVDKDGNVTIGTGKDATTVNAEQFKNQVAAARSQEEAAKAAEKIPELISKMSQKMGTQAGKALDKVFMGSSGSALTQENLKDLQAYTSNIHRLGEMYHSLSQEEQAIFGSFENFENHVLDSVKGSESAFANATKDLQAMGVEVEFSSKMTAAATKGYASQLENIAITSGEVNAELVNDSFNKLTKKLSSEQMEVFMRELNSIDWANMNDWKEFPSILNDVGIALPIEELEDFIKTASESANAIEKIDFTKVQEGLNDLQTYIQGLKTGEVGRNMSSTTYQALIEINPDLVNNFGETIDGNFFYLGGTIEDLITTIEENTATWVTRTTSELNNQIKAGELMSELQTGYTWNGIDLDITQWMDWDKDAFDDSSAENYLKQFMKMAKERNIDLSQLGVKNLSNTTDVDKLAKSPEKMEQLMTDLTKVFTSLASNTKKLEGGMERDLSKVYQIADITTNTVQAQQYREKISSGGTLTEGEWASYRARQSTITMQAADVNQVDYENYTKTLKAVEELEQGFLEGRYTLEEFQEAYKIATADLMRYEEVVTNKTAKSNMKKYLGETLTLLEDMQKQYDNLAETDIEGKMEVVSKAVAKFGIQVTEENYELLNSLTKIALGGGEAGMQALAKILDFSAAKYGLTQQEFLELEKQNWKTATDNQVKYADTMVAAGMAQWKVINGVTQFVWNSQAAIEASLDETGAKIERWLSSYDRLYNLNAELNGILRQRENLEKTYERLLKSETATAQELTDLIANQLITAEKQAFLESEKAKEALGRMAYEAEQNQQYSSLYSLDLEAGMLTIDEEAIKNLGWTEEEGKSFENFIQNMEGYFSDYQDSTDELENIQDFVEDIRNTGRNEMSNLYDTIRNGLLAKYQEQVDNLSSIYDVLNQTREDFVNELQTLISETRQIRDNLKQEEEIADMETRLAFLQRDTSGANAEEILQLQSQLEERKTAYSDTLTDQSIQSLQDENAKASEQRERQIAIMQAQLDAYASSPQIWSDIKKIMDDGLAAVASGQKFTDTEAGYLCTLAEDLSAKNPIATEEYYDALETTAKTGAVYGGFTQVSDAVEGLVGTKGPITLGDLGEAVSVGFEAMKEDISKNAKELEGLKNNSIPTISDKVEGALTQALNAVYSGNVSLSDAVRSSFNGMGISIKGVKNSLASIPGSVSSGVGSIATALSNAMYSGANAIISAIKGIDLGRTSGGGTYSGTSIINKPSYINNTTNSGSNSTPTTSTTTTSEYPEKINLGTIPTAADLQKIGETAPSPNFDPSAPQIHTKENPYHLDDLRETEIKVKKDTELGAVQSSERYSYKGENYIHYGEDLFVKESELGFYYKTRMANDGSKRYSDKCFKATKGTTLYRAYKTGGLADYTGPAWLDGTPSRPEMVLNARDTENFIQLKNILADILEGARGNVTSKQNSQIASFDIDINVENISDDYDVEQLADKIREIIYEDSIYRNVNTISLTR